MSTPERPDAPPRSRRRLSREERRRQLIAVAWGIVRSEGTDALTLGRLAQQSGVTKPVVYDHFGTRNGLLAALYREFDRAQSALIDAAIEKSPATFTGRARVLADSYVECVLAQGREIPGVSAALRTSPELEQIKRECEGVFLEKCRTVLLPYSASGSISLIGLMAMLGAAEALSYAAAGEEIAASDAKNELYNIIVAMMSREGDTARKAAVEGEDS